MKTGRGKDHCDEPKITSYRISDFKQEYPRRVDDAKAFNCYNIEIDDRFRVYTRMKESLLDRITNCLYEGSALINPLKALLR